MTTIDYDRVPGPLPKVGSVWEWTTAEGIACVKVTGYCRIHRRIHILVIPKDAAEVGFMQTPVDVSDWFNLPILRQ